MDRKQFFSDIAQEWEREHENQEERERLKMLFRHFPLAKGNWVLDVGCGTGRLIPLLQEAIGKEGLLVESDFSRAMLKVGKAKYLYKNLKFIQSDAKMIALKDNIFDVVICFALFPHLPDKAKALKEFRRILKSGNPLVIAHPMSRQQLNNFHSQVKGPVSRDYLPDNQKMEELFSSAGFRGLTIKDKPSLYLATARA